MDMANALTVKQLRTGAGDLPEIEPREFRNAVGKFATGVCVMTAAVNGFEPIGMTVNSFTSLSLDPALVLWSIQNNSSCCPAFDACDRFAVNILASDQQDISNVYASKGAHHLAAEHYETGQTGAPVLHGVLAAFECGLWARYPGGDHTIIVGEVLKLHARDDGAPLLFHAGKYGELA